MVARESNGVLVDADLVAVRVPRRYGGHQADLTTQLEILNELAYADASISWIGSLYTGCFYPLTKFADEAQNEVWPDDPAATVCGALTPAGMSMRVRGGYRISGRRAFASGCDYATWALLSCLLLDDEGAIVNIGCFLAAMSELHIEPTWFTLSMRGTASDTLVGDDIFVPDYRVLPLLDESGQLHPAFAVERHRPWSRRRAVRGARLALDDRCATGHRLRRDGRRTRAAAQSQIAYSSYVEQILAVTTETDVADAAVKIDSALLLARRTAADADRAGDDDAVLDMRTRGLIRQDCGHSARLLRGSMDTLVQLCGVSAVPDSNPLQRHSRPHDVYAARVRSPIAHGRGLRAVMFGLDPSVTVC